MSVILKEQTTQLVLKSQKADGSTEKTNKLLVMLQWQSAGNKDLDLSVMFRKQGEKDLPTGNVNADATLYYGSKTALNGNARLTADNTTGADVNTQSTLTQLGVNPNVVSKLANVAMDEACFIDLNAIAPNYSEAYISVLDYNNHSFGDAEKIDIRFFNAETGEQVGDVWQYDACLQDDGNGFIVGKIVQENDEWVVKSLAHPVKDEDGNSHLTFHDANYVINRTGI